MALKLSTLASAAVLCAALLALPAFAAETPPPTDQAVAAKAQQLVTGPGTYVLGNPNGDVTIVEFSDYNCPYCKAIEPRLQALLKADPKVRLVMKEFPILGPQSLTATKAAIASARQGKYAAFHSAMMLNKGGLTEEQIFDTAKRVGLDVARLRRDMASPAVMEAVYVNLNLARSLRLFQTPTVIVNNHVLTGPSAEFDFPRAVAVARGN
jgi:protein-disulfide isomerase